MIDSYTFGKITIDGKDYEDIKIIGEKVIPWHYTEHHTVTKQDVIEIFEDKPEAVVIGIGTSRCVRVNNDVIGLAKEKGIELVIGATKKACEDYNSLKKKGKRVNAIIHATC